MFSCPNWFPVFTKITFQKDAIAVGKQRAHHSALCVEMSPSVARCSQLVKNLFQLQQLKTTQPIPVQILTSASYSLTTAKQSICKMTKTKAQSPEQCSSAVCCNLTWHYDPTYRNQSALTSLKNAFCHVSAMTTSINSVRVISEPSNIASHSTTVIDTY